MAQGGDGGGGGGNGGGRMKAEWEKICGALDPDKNGSQTAKTASNVCFAAVVVTVLSLTAMAVMYQPPDPWLQPWNTLGKLKRNVTVKPDESVVVTAEDEPLSSAALPLPPPINRTFVDAEAAEARLNSSASADCSGTEAVNCSAPAVLFAIEQYNLGLFHSLEFYSYATPVRGAAPRECDVAWTYRSSKDGSPRLFRDYRRYRLAVTLDCRVRVERGGAWHSGQHARPFWRRPRPFPRDPRDEDMLGGDDAVRNVNASEFARGKYLYYQRGGDYCKSMNQYVWSLLCAFGEARYLNRTFVMDMEICLASENNLPGHADEPGKDFRFYFDFDHLRSHLPLIEKRQFLADWAKWDGGRAQKVSSREVEYTETPMDLKRDDRTTVLTRVFDRPQANLNWYRVCDGETADAFHRPWELLWKSRRIDAIVLAICARLGWEYDAVHVVRGGKAENRALWPNLDADTRPEALAGKLDARLVEGRNVYIATNEPDPHYFDKLRGKWRIFQLHDFEELWAPGSEWFNETSALIGGGPVDFDGYMRVEVDSEVLYKARTRVETFNDLTQDCKNGINSCS